MNRSLLRAFRLLSVLYLFGVTIPACGTQDHRAEMKAKFLGRRGDQVCFVGGKTALRPNGSGCYRQDDSMQAASASFSDGQCMTVKLADHTRFPDEAAGFVQLESDGCEMSQSEADCWVQQVVQQPRKTRSCLT